MLFRAKEGHTTAVACGVCERARLTQGIEPDNVIPTHTGLHRTSCARCTCETCDFGSASDAMTKPLGVHASGTKAHAVLVQTPRYARAPTASSTRRSYRTPSSRTPLSRPGQRGLQALQRAHPCGTVLRYVYTSLTSLRGRTRLVTRPTGRFSTHAMRPLGADRVS